MKPIEYKGYFIHPSQHVFIDDCSVTAFPGSGGIFYFKSIRAAKCWITRHLAVRVASAKKLEKS